MRAEKELIGEAFKTNLNFSHHLRQKSIEKSDNGFGLNKANFEIRGAPEGYKSYHSSLYPSHREGTSPIIHFETQKHQNR